MEMEDVGGKKDYLGGYSKCYLSSFCLELVVVLRDLDFLGGRTLCHWKKGMTCPFLISLETSNSFSDLGVIFLSGREIGVAVTT